MRYSKNAHAYFKFPAHGISNAKYRHLGKHIYQLSGVDMLGKRDTFKIRFVKGYLYDDHVKYSRHRPGRIISEASPNI
ncbi:MAG: hypothetical protein LKF37_10045 [Lentilactobacillus diolivorans]|nr:hypothetical protein [Lentilactobacillus diolivorans]